MGTEGRLPGHRVTALQMERSRTLEDSRLLALVSRGDAAAFESIVRRYTPQLAGYCRRLGMSDHATEDILQQSYLKAWIALSGGLVVRELRPWLFRIVHNAAVSAARDARELPRALDDRQGELDRCDERSNIDRLLALRATLAEVAALPPAQRDAILLSSLHGRSRNEVAAALGLSESAVRGLLYRARTTLRRAAAIVPPPAILGWACGLVRKLAASAGNIVDSTTPTGVEAAGLATKATALVITAAAVVAGVAALPPRSHRVREGGRPPAQTTASADSDAAIARPVPYRGNAPPPGSAPSTRPAATAGAPVVHLSPSMGHPVVQPIARAPETPSAPSSPVDVHQSHAGGGAPAAPATSASVTEAAPLAAATAPAVASTPGSDTRAGQQETPPTGAGEGAESPTGSEADKTDDGGEADAQHGTRDAGSDDNKANRAPRGESESVLTSGGERKAPPSE
jgi:RNA polymerase sigma factor (sigma-70 family)